MIRSRNRARGFSGGGAPFVPTDIAGLQLWLDASDTATITQAANAVSQWNDKSGNANHATQGVALNQPSINTRTINGRNVIDFDGLTDTMPITLATIASITQGANTSFVVSVYDAGTNFRQYAGESVSAAQRFGFYNDGSPLGFIHAANGTRASVGTRGTSPFIQVGIRNGTSCQIYLDSGLTATNASAVNFTLVNLSVGLGANSDGAVAEVITYNTALSNADINRVGQYLSAKWGIAWVNI